MAKDKPETAAGEQSPAILRVASFADQRCRAGRTFTREPVDLLLSCLSDDDIAAIEGDPQLKTERA